MTQPTGYYADCTVTLGLGILRATPRAGVQAPSAAMHRLIVTVACLLAAAPASAVSCGGQQSVKQAYAAAQDVFSAHVEEIYTGQGFGRDDFHFARLHVLNVWKGDLAAGEIVQATAEDTVSFISDGFIPLHGSNVLVYASGTQPFFLGTCSRTAPLDSTRDTRELEKLSRRSRGG